MKEESEEERRRRIFDCERRKGCDRESLLHDCLEVRQGVFHHLTARDFTSHITLRFLIRLQLHLSRTLSTTDLCDTDLWKILQRDRSSSIKSIIRLMVYWITIKLTETVARIQVTCVYPFWSVVVVVVYVIFKYAFMLSKPEWWVDEDEVDEFSWWESSTSLAVVVLRQKHTWFPFRFITGIMFIFF